MSFMNTLSRRAPTTRSPSRSGMLMYIMSALSVELGRMDISVSPRSEAWISGRKRWFSMSRGSLSESARTPPSAPMTVILVGGLPAEVGDQAFQVSGGGPREVREDLSFEDVGQVLQFRGALVDVVRPHQRRGEHGHRRGQEDDDGGIPREEP